MLIFKIVHAPEWHEAERAGSYPGSAKDKTDGFLHFSGASQLTETLRQYYAEADDLLLVAVDETGLGDALKYEHAPSRGEDFPHLYAALPLSMVIWARQLKRDSRGDWILPELDQAGPTFV